jgi:tagaturonate epimerase
MHFAKYSMGIGDRFARQGESQLAAFVKARELGVDVAPVWNKSNREHNIVHSEPTSVRGEADAAVKALRWDRPYFVDADHIGIKTVDRFLAPSDFFTIDVADFIGKPVNDADVREFVSANEKLVGKIQIPGIDQPLDATVGGIEAIARKYLYAVQEAGRIYRYIESAKGRDNFIAEVSMDETDQPQTPLDLLFILAALGQEKIPLRTIAPKFTGRFNKGVDYVGDVKQFEREFNADLAVIGFAVSEFGLPVDLKLSVHSGSDKFSLYGPIRRALEKHQAGLHLKTAGTTWLAELAGLALAEGEGLRIAREVYIRALDRFDELCAPYATVIDIDRKKLPSSEEIARWSGAQYFGALNHDPLSPSYNSSFRQLLHVGFKVAAELGTSYLDALSKNQSIVAAIVTENIFERHLKRVFIGGVVDRS